MDSETLDPSFIQPPEHRPKPTITDPGNSIPIIDLSTPTPHLVPAIASACRDWGFFIVTNHSVPSHHLSRLLHSTKEFFSLPPEEKRKVRRDEVNPLGYYDAENTKNVRDWKEVFDYALREHQFPASPDPDCRRVETIKNQCPEHPSDFRDVCEEYMKEVEKLFYKLLELVSLSLGLPATRLNGFFEDQISYVRLNHYPACPSPDLALGVGRHKDNGGITVLAQDDVGGLEVRRRSDGEWVKVRPVPDSYVINIGDIVQVWSNDRYKSAEHRVTLNSERERFSVPFFFNPSHSTMVAPLEELVDERDPAHYRAYNWGKFLKTRKNSNFRKQAVENIQIDHFRITKYINPLESICLCIIFINVFKEIYCFV